MYIKDKEKGVILISVLLIVLVLSAIAMSIGNNFLLAFKRSMYQDLQTNSFELFKNIESMKYALTLSGKGFGENIIIVKIAIDENYTINTIPCCDHIVNVKGNKEILFSDLKLPVPLK